MAQFLALSPVEAFDTPATLGLAVAFVLATTYRIRRHRMRVR